MRRRAILPTATAGAGRRGRRPVRVAVVVAGVTAMLAAGCGDDGDSAAVDSVVSETEESTGADTDDGGDAAATGTGDAASSEPIEAGGGEPVATVSADVTRGINREGQVPLRAEVTELAREGEHVNLTFTLTNEHDTDDYAPYPHHDWSDDSGRSIDGTRLVDQENQRAHLPAVDSGGSCLCSGSDIELQAGGSVDLHATFGGVPEDVSELDIHIPYFPALSGVPVSG